MYILLLFINIISPIQYYRNTLNSNIFILYLALFNNNNDYIIKKINNIFLMQV